MKSITPISLIVLTLFVWFAGPVSSADPPYIDKVPIVPKEYAFQFAINEDPVFSITEDLENKRIIITIKNGTIFRIYEDGKVEKMVWEQLSPDTGITIHGGSSIWHNSDNLLYLTPGDNNILLGE